MDLRRSFGRISLVSFVSVLLIGLSGVPTKASFSGDAGFGTRGLVSGPVGLASLSATMSPRVLAVDRHGRALFGSASGGAWQIMRFLPDGGLDASFGDEGSVVIDRWAGYGSTSVGANLGSGVVRPDGRILLVGYIGSAVMGNNARTGDASMIVAQLMPDGSPDLSFGRDGSNFIGAGKGAVKAVLQPDGVFWWALSSRSGAPVGLMTELCSGFSKEEGSIGPGGPGDT